jgi:hypothetical protein
MRNNNKNFAMHRRLLTGTLALLLGTVGCSISQTKSGSEDGDKNVSIQTPFGGMKVQSDVDPRDVGLTVYPGARLKPSDDSDKNSNRVNLSISTPAFGLKVVALDYLSDASSEKIKLFYLKDMARYGKVIECKGTNTSASTHEDNLKLELNCNDVHNGSEGTTLKAGEGSSQHLVEIHNADKGSDFGLVYIQVRGKAETM